MSFVSLHVEDALQNRSIDRFLNLYYVDARNTSDFFCTFISFTFHTCISSCTYSTYGPDSTFQTQLFLICQLLSHSHGFMAIWSADIYFYISQLNITSIIHGRFLFDYNTMANVETKYESTNY